MMGQDERVRLASAVGTGRAALVGLDLDERYTSGPMYQLLTENEPGANPISGCHALRESIEDDWPGYSFTVIANERARYLEWRSRMKRLVGVEPSAEEYAAT